MDVSISAERKYGQAEARRIHGRIPGLAGAALTSLIFGLACGGGGGSSSGTTGIQVSGMVTYLPFNASTGIISPASPTTAPYQNASVTAILPNGTSIQGTFVPATNSYTLTGVPAGYYWLHAGNSYIWTNQTAVDLGTQVGGRMPGMLGSAGTYLAWNLTGLDAWKTNDYLVNYDFNSDLYSSMSDLSNNVTTFAGNSLWERPLLDTTQGDAAQLEQVVDSVTSGTEHLGQALKFSQPTALTMANGTTTHWTGSLADIDQSGSVTLNFSRSAFAGFRSQYQRTSVTVPVGPFLEFDAQPGASTYGSCGAWLDGLYVQDDNPANTTDLNEGAVAAPALAPGFERIAYAGESYHVALQLPGTSLATDIKAMASETHTLTLPDATHPLQPMISLPQNPTINGASLLTDQSSVGVTPILAWTAPSLGTPQGYLVTIYQLNNVSSATGETAIAWLYLDGSQTTTQIPAGILTAGDYYFFLITAYADTSYSPTTAPWHNHMFPYGLGQMVTNKIQS